MICKKGLHFSEPQHQRKPSKTQLTSSSFSDPLQIAFSLLNSLQFLFALLFAGYLPFYLALSCSLLHSSHFVCPILASFLTLLCVFLYSFFTFHFMLSVVILSFQPKCTQNLFSLKQNNFLWLTIAFISSEYCR